MNHKAWQKICSDAADAESEKVERETKGQIALIAAVLSDSKFSAFWPPGSPEDRTLDQCAEWYAKLAWKFWNAVGNTDA